MSARFPFARKQVEHETNSSVSTLPWAWARGAWKGFISTLLPCFSGPEVRAAAARGDPILYSDLEGVFPAKSISPNTDLRGEKGVGSGTVTIPDTFESCIRVTHMFLGGVISYGGGGAGCRNYLKRLVAHMFRCLFLAPTVPAGSQVARKYDPLLLRGNVRFVPTMCVPEASHTIICVL